jgi:Ca2+-binding RTX toxin-like protein
MASSTRSTPTRRLTVLGAAIAMLLGLSPTTASAAVSCSYDAGFSDATVTLSEPGDVATVERSGRRITSNGANCGPATVENTDYVEFYSEAAGDVTGIISLQGGPFVPGADTGSCSFTDDIGFTLWLDGAGSSTAGDRLVIRGADGGDRIRFGVAASPCNGILFRVVNLNVGEPVPDPDVSDVSSNHVDHWEVRSGPGPDRVSGAGGAGAGAVFNAPLELRGGAKGDNLTGGMAADVIRGERHDDVLIGGPGPDLLVGGAGTDTCKGGGGADVLQGCERT